MTISTWLASLLYVGMMMGVTYSFIFRGFHRSLNAGYCGPNSCYLPTLSLPTLRRREVPSSSSSPRRYGEAIVGRICGTHRLHQEDRTEVAESMRALVDPKSSVEVEDKGYCMVDDKQVLERNHNLVRSDEDTQNRRCEDL